MTRQNTLKKIIKLPKEEEDWVEHYLAPAPPKNGKIVGLDCHPDTFTAAIFVGQTPHDARKIGSRENLSLAALLKWAKAELSPKDIILMEAGSNSFEVCKQLGDLGLQVCVLESCHVGKHAKTYADNDRMAAARIALVYLAGNAPCVWIPDEQSRERRELLHIYSKSVTENTAAINGFKSWLNQHGIRLGNRSLSTKTTIPWIKEQKEWDDLQNLILEEHLSKITESKARRKRLYDRISLEMAKDPMMLKCLKALGVGPISGFALVAVIGDINRFHRSEKLVAYIGLNPGQLESGKGKNIRLGVGKRGRGDLRNLLTQGAQAVLRSGKNTDLGKWGWKLFARKGNRNIAVSAVARKLAVQIWHILKGHPPLVQESEKSFRTKLQKVAVAIGVPLRKELGLGKTLAEAIEILRLRSLESHPPVPNSPNVPV